MFSVVKGLPYSFDSRTRAGCGPGHLYPCEGLCILIRTPAQGATPKSPYNSGCKGILIRTPAQGATAAAHQRKSHLPPDFDSRTHVGVRPSSQIDLYSLSHFDSRTRVGCDFICALSKGLYLPEFRFAHPRRVRRGEEVIFQSYLFISIHAPAWGPILYQDAPNRQTHRDISIPAPIQGATSQTMICAFTSGFQFAHPHKVR